MSGYQHISPRGVIDAIAHLVAADIAVTATPENGYIELAVSSADGSCRVMLSKAGIHGGWYVRLPSPLIRDFYGLGPCNGGLTVGPMTAENLPSAVRILLDGAG